MAVVVLPVPALDCLLIWLLLLQSLPRQGHYDMFINENIGFCCPHLPLPPVTSAEALLIFLVLFMILKSGRIVIMACTLLLGYHYLNSACSHLLLLIAYPIPTLTMPQHSLMPHLKVHHTCTSTTEGWAAITATVVIIHISLGWLKMNNIGNEAAVQTSH